MQSCARSFVLCANLDPVPQTRIEHVTVTDLSSADSVTDSVFDVNEHRGPLTRQAPSAPGPRLAMSR